jgi:hypothetical protein
MKTKLVTCFYADHTGYPYWGKLNRKEWYAYSLISLCNLGCPIICYTDVLGFDFLIDLKQKHNLNNLEVKLFYIYESPYHKDITRIRLANPEIFDNPQHPLYTLPVTIYWIKWMLLQKEYEQNIYLYWIDIGLSTGSLIPFKLNKYKNENGFQNRYLDEENHREHEFKYFIFDQVFNSNSINQINSFVDDKILNLCRGYVMDNDYKSLEKFLGEEFSSDVINSNKFPVAAMFGGQSDKLVKYIDEFDRIAQKIIISSNEDYLCTEQEIMGYIHAKHPEWFKDWNFSTFYHDESSCWEGLHNENYPLKSFYKFFINPYEN